MGIVSKKLASNEEQNVISGALAIGLIATEGIGEWNPKRKAMLAMFKRMHHGSKAQEVYLDPARELLNAREQLGHVIEP